MVTKRDGLTSMQWDAEPVDVPRYLASLRRGKGLMVAIVVLMTTAVFVLSTMLPKTYEASARLVVDDRPGGTEPADSETVTRRLATVRALITTREVRARAAARLDGESAETLEDKLAATADQEANIVEVHATDNDAAGAAAIANTVARTFVSMQRTAEQQRFARARAELRQALDRVRSPVSAEALALRERLSELSVSEASAGPDAHRCGARAAAAGRQLTPTHSQHDLRVLRRGIPRGTRSARSRSARTAHGGRPRPEPPHGHAGARGPAARSSKAARWTDRGRRVPGASDRAGAPVAHGVEDRRRGRRASRERPLGNRRRPCADVRAARSVAHFCSLRI